MSAEQENNPIGEQFTKAEGFVVENKKSLLVIGGTIVALILLYVGYQTLIINPREKEAAGQMFMAEKYFEQDSLDKAINGDGNFLGFAAIADEYGSTKAGAIANYYLGYAYLRQGQYELAIEALEEFNSADEVLQTLAYSGIADAYLELNKMEDAVGFYKKAAAKSKDPFTTPVVLMKLGMTYEMMNEPQKALENYEKIKKEYTESTEARDIEKYIARASAKI
jgi:tetratricopeptide (TPR) repeat protein